VGSSELEKKIFKNGGKKKKKKKKMLW